MADYIDRQAALDAIDLIQMSADDTWYEFYQRALTKINTLPSVDVRDNRVGKWIECETSEHWKCSECGDRAPMYWDFENHSYAEWLSPVCPNCGADMRGEVENEIKC